MPKIDQLRFWNPQRNSFGIWGYLTIFRQKNTGSLKIINFRNIATKSKTLNTWQHFWMEALFWFCFDNNNICTFAYTVNYMNWLSFENETRRFGWRGNLFIRNANLICKQRIVKVRVKFCDTTLHIHISISLNK